MDVMEAIAQRQSCRNFTGEKIGERELHVLLQAAQAAPVADGDYSGVHIAVLQDPALLERLEQYAREEFGGEGPDRPLHTAPTLLSISCRAGEEAAAWANASCIAENVMLAAAGLGLGSLYLMGVPAAAQKNRELCRALAVPEGFAPYVMVGVGRPAAPQPRRALPSGRIAVDFR